MPKQKPKTPRKAAPVRSAPSLEAGVPAGLAAAEPAAMPQPKKVTARPKRSKKIKAKAIKLAPDAGVAAMASGAKRALAALLPPKLPRKPMRLPPLERLELAIDEVKRGVRVSPRTRKLLGSGTPKMAQKVIEEAGEVAIEALQGHTADLVNETVDLFYNTLALLNAAGVTLDMLWAEMERREGALGMSEKLPKPGDGEG